MEGNNGQTTVTVDMLKEHCDNKCQAFEKAFDRLATFMMSIMETLKEVTELKELLRKHMADERKKEESLMNLNGGE
jgi:prefoldin subunit 5